MISYNWKTLWNLLILNEWFLKKRIYNWINIPQRIVFTRCILCWIESNKILQNIKRWNWWCNCRRSSLISESNKTHWLSWDPIYLTYTNIKRRCNESKNISYQNYWGRWIKCEWDTFEDFYKDMWESYKEHIDKFWKNNTSIDRIDVNWNYCKENCKWYTNLEQWRNKRNNNFIEYNWEIKTLMEWSIILWIKRTTLNERLRKYKWSIEDSFTKPVK